MLTISEMHEHLRRLFHRWMLEGNWHPSCVPEGVPPVRVGEDVGWAFESSLAPEPVSLDDADRAHSELRAAVLSVRTPEAQEKWLYRHNWWKNALSVGERWLKEDYAGKTVCSRESALHRESCDSLLRRSLRGGTHA